MKTFLLFLVWLISITFLSLYLNEPEVQMDVILFWTIAVLGMTFILYLHCEVWGKDLEERSNDHKPNN